MRSEWSNIEALALGIMAILLLLAYISSEVAGWF